MPRLSKRLLAIASMVPQGSITADVGADHGKLGIYLLENNICSRIMSIENKIGPFSKMKENYIESGLFHRVDCSLSDGISELNDDVDCVVIAGVGGLLTLDILEKHPEKLNNVKTIVLDPHKDLYQVRKRCSSLGYAISGEKLVYEDKIYYCIMKLEKTNDVIEYSDDELMFGPCLLKHKDELFAFYMKDQIETINEILKEKLPVERIKYYKALKERIESNL